ncbi:racemase/epimerase [Aureococcus anophagefferens]|nr:racemase/epimerase [Aureococcus anophagefferens]
MASQLTRSPSSTIDDSDAMSTTSSSSSANPKDDEVWDSATSVLVTGGAGFVGSHVAEALLARGERRRRRRGQRLLRREPQGGESGRAPPGDNVRIFRGDICDVAFLEQVFETCPMPRRVVHMAARAGVRPSIDDPFVYVHSNVHGTTRLLELAAKHGSDSFVFASSSSVYGGSKKALFSETDAVDLPVSPYAATKKACELLAYTYHHLYKMNIAGLRFFTVFGPRGRPDMAPLKFVDKISRGEPIDRFGDGSSSRDYTYVDDVVDGVLKALDRPLGYQIYNLGNGSPTRLNDFIKLVEKYTGKNAVIRQKPDQPGDVPRTCADISKAKTLLDYDPQTPFPEGIRKLVEWYQSAEAAAAK